MKSLPQALLLNSPFAEAEERRMDDSDRLTETERQLLMAAAVHGLGPGTDLSRANTARVVNQVLQWRGAAQKKSATGGGKNTATRCMRRSTLP